MPTRVKRPSLIRKLTITASLIGFLAYLGYHVLNGHFGIRSRSDMMDEIAVLQARDAALQVEIDSYRHRIALLDPHRLDPDILTERARALLGMVRADELLIVTED